jgi:hypothetical protein
MTAKYALDFIGARQVLSGSSRLNDPPFFFTDIVTSALVLKLLNKPREPILVVCRPVQYPIQNLFDLVSGHT